MIKILSLFSIIIFLAGSFATELVLQNGNDNYSGCEDTYLSDDDGQNGQNTNFGDETMCSLQGYH